jgi:short subunit dehydrogenase-like uncharacterized protein
MSEKCLVVIYGASGYTAGMIAEDLRERVELSTSQQRAEFEVANWTCSRARSSIFARRP